MRSRSDPSRFEYSQEQTFSVAVEAVKNACLEVARDMGLAVVRRSTLVAQISFRERASIRSTQVGVAVYLSARDGQTLVRLVGDDRVGHLIPAPEQARRVVGVFADRLQAELQPSATTAVNASVRTRHRRVLGFLRFLEWAPLALVALGFVVTLAVSALRQGHVNAPLGASAWFALMCSAGADVARRSVAGTDAGAEDYVLLAGLALCAVFVLPLIFLI